MNPAIEPNALRWRRDSHAGHYESFFVRANHPTLALAFWIRYTIFSPRHNPHDAAGELWAIVFDADSARHVVVKQAFPVSTCRFDDQQLGLHIGAASLTSNTARGRCEMGAHQIEWDLAYRSPHPSLLLLPANLYSGGFPKAKSLVSAPLAQFAGRVVVDGHHIDVIEWRGSQNHNWGSQHTDRYAWAQVAGFDGHDDSFLEVASAKLKIGPLWTPWITPLVLRHRGIEYRLNSLVRALRASAQLDYFDWRFETHDQNLRIHGHVQADWGDLVALRYANPPGGFKTCLNSKIARCELRIHHANGTSETLRTAHRAAFEILTDDGSHGVPLAC